IGGNGLAYNLGVAAQPVSPQTATHQNRTIRSTLFFRQKRPAQDRLNSQRAEVVSRDSLHLHALRPRSAGEGHHVPAPRAHSRKQRGRPAPVEIRGRRSASARASAASLWGSLPNRHEPIRLRVRQGTQVHSVDETENGGGGDDSERERQNRGNGEARISPQGAQRIQPVVRVQGSPPWSTYGPSIIRNLTNWSRPVYAAPDAPRREPSCAIRPRPWEDVRGAPLWLADVLSCRWRHPGVLTPGAIARALCS